MSNPKFNFDQFQTLSKIQAFHYSAQYQSFERPFFHFLFHGDLEIQGYYAHETNTACENINSRLALLTRFISPTLSSIYLTLYPRLNPTQIIADSRDL